MLLRPWKANKWPIWNTRKFFQTITFPNLTTYWELHLWILYVNKNWWYLTKTHANGYNCDRCWSVRMLTKTSDIDLRWPQIWTAQNNFGRRRSFLMMCIQYSTFVHVIQAHFNLTVSLYFCSDDSKPFLLVINKKSNLHVLYYEYELCINCGVLVVCSLLK